MNLTTEQINAAHSSTPTTYCSAAAGSGKTRTMVERVRWLIQERHVAAKSICVVTFTGAAAKELQSRLIGLIFDGSEEYKLGHCGTLHALCLRMCNKYHEMLGLPDVVTVLTEADTEAMVEEVGKELNYKGSKVALCTDFQQYCFGEHVANLKLRTMCQEIMHRMRESGELSYNLLLTMGRKVIQSQPMFQHLLVDEAQDSAPADSAIYQAMRCETKFIIGDPNQAIYGFRGSDPEWFRDGCLEYADAFHELTTNYRSSVEVVAASQRIASMLKVKVGSSTKAAPDAPKGRISIDLCPDEGFENGRLLIHIKAASASTVAVLLRTNSAAARVRTFLQDAGVTVSAPARQTSQNHPPLAIAALRAMAAPNSDRMVAKYLIEREGSVVVTTMLRAAASTCQSLAKHAGLWDCSQVMLNSPADAKAIMSQWFARQSTFPSQLDMTTAGEWIQELACGLPEPFTLQELVLAAQAPAAVAQPTSGVYVGTVHSAKGLEWDRVLLPCFDAETWPGNKTGEELEEEIRLAYVAVTRAREAVILSCALRRKNEYKPWIIEDRTPSPLMLAAGNMQ